MSDTNPDYDPNLKPHSLKDALVLAMGRAEKWRCAKCGSTFGDSEALYVHRIFCRGVRITGNQKG